MRGQEKKSDVKQRIGMTMPVRHHVFSAVQISWLRAEGVTRAHTHTNKTQPTNLDLRALQIVRVTLYVLTTLALSLLILLDKNNRKHQRNSSNFNDHDGSFDLMFSVDIYWQCVGFWG